MALLASPRAQALSAALLLALAVIALYWPAAGFDYFIYDDGVSTWGNPVVAGGLSPQGVAAAFSCFDLDLWIPLTLISYQLDISLFGLGPFGHHLVNILLHGADAGLLLFLLFRLTGSVGRSSLAAALWALHPLRVESVAWIAERKDVLSVFFLLLALFAYERRARTGSRGWYAALVLLFAAGLLSKPTLVVFPFLLLVLDFWPLRRMGGEKGWSRATVFALLREKIPLILMAAAVALLALATLRTWERAMPVFERLQRLAVGAYTYLGRTAWPRDLFFSFDYSFRDPAGPVLTAAAAGSLVLLTALSLRARHRHPALLAGWAWYLMALLPVSGLLATGAQYISDRFTHLPHLLLIPALVWTAAGLLPPSRRCRALAWTAALLLLLTLALLTHRQLPVWTDSESILVHSLRERPRDLEMRWALGELYLWQDRPAEAEREFRTLIASGPDLAPGRVGLAEALLRRRSREDASTQLSAALRLPLKGPVIRNRLARCLRKVGRRQEAAAILAETLRQDPADQEARALLLRLREEE
jgi:tetratricopeptide (TPR) repeat protein